MSKRATQWYSRSVFPTEERTEEINWLITILWFFTFRARKKLMKAFRCFSAAEYQIHYLLEERIQYGEIVNSKEARIKEVESGEERQKMIDHFNTIEAQIIEEGLNMKNEPVIPEYMGFRSIGKKNTIAYEREGITLAPIEDDKWSVGWLEVVKKEDEEDEQVWRFKTVTFRHMYDAVAFLRPMGLEIEPMQTGDKENEGEAELKKLFSAAEN